MTSPLFALKKPHALAFAGLVTWLKQSPALGRVKVWRSWEGLDDDAAPWAVDDECGVRLTPELEKAEVMALHGGGTARIYSRPMTVTVEAWIPSGAVADPLDLADALSDRLEPQGNTPDRIALDALMQRLSIQEITELQPLSVASEAEQAVVAIGKYLIDMWF